MRATDPVVALALALAETRERANRNSRARQMSEPRNILTEMLRKTGMKRERAEKWAPHFLAALTAAGYHLMRWQDIGEAKKDNTMYLLAVSGGERAFENLPPGELSHTIGFNALEHDGDDRWRMAGWCWEHDHIVEGDGEPVLCAPLPPAPPEPAP